MSQKIKTKVSQSEINPFFKLLIFVPSAMSHSGTTMKRIKFQLLSESLRNNFHNLMLNNLTGKLISMSNSQEIHKLEALVKKVIEFFVSEKSHICSISRLFSQIKTQSYLSTRR